MARRSAGILLYRRRDGAIEVLLAHPGGPFWVRKDDGAWTIPKGEIAEDEDPLAAARREFTEETGAACEGPFLPLGEVRQKSGKRVAAWACEGDMDPAALQSNTCEIEWPPRSGRRLEVPEVDRVGWFPLEAASPKLMEAQRPFLARLLQASNTSL